MVDCLCGECWVTEEMCDCAVWAPSPRSPRSAFYRDADDDSPVSLCCISSPELRIYVYLVWSCCDVMVFAVTTACCSTLYKDVGNSPCTYLSVRRRVRSEASGESRRVQQGKETQRRVAYPWHSFSCRSHSWKRTLPDPPFSFLLFYIFIWSGVIGILVWHQNKVRMKL